MSFETSRLIFRRWQDEDKAPFSAMNSDHDVMEHFPTTLSREESDVLIERIESGFDKNGFGLWAVERKDNGAFIGFIGLGVPHLQAEFTPCVEIGWRLARGHWGRGFATEGAKKVLEVGFGDFDLEEIVSFTAKSNSKSIRVMERIGLKHTLDFDHPSLSPDSPLYAHVLYQIRRDKPC